MRDAVRAELTDPSYRDTALHLREEIAALSEPANVARGLRDRFGDG